MVHTSTAILAWSLPCQKSTTTADHHTKEVKIKISQNIILTAEPKQATHSFVAVAGISEFVDGIGVLKP